MDIIVKLISGRSTADWKVTFGDDGQVLSVAKAVRGRWVVQKDGIRRMRAIKQASNIRAIRIKSERRL